MKKEIKQLNFAKGMIENIKQDLPNQVNPVFESAAWIENFNPNVQTGSLTIRAHQNNNLHTIGKDNILDLSLYSKLIDFSATNYNKFSNADEQLRETLVVSTDYIALGKPSLADGYVSFVRRFSYRAGSQQDFSPHIDPNTGGGIESEATAVVAWVPYIDANKDHVEGWREPFYNAETYPGWYALGTYYDHARYGESVIFVTYPKFDMQLDGTPATSVTNAYTLSKEAKALHYPCYIWQWWDLSKKREGVNGDQRFWNGLDVGDLTDPKYRLWKIRRPSMQIAKDNAVEAVQLTNLVITNYGITRTETWSKFDGTDCNGTNEKNVQLLIWESPIQTYKLYQTTLGIFGWDKTPYTDFIAKLTKNDYALTSAEKGYINPFLNVNNISYLDTFETLNIQDLYTFDNAGTEINRRNKQNNVKNGVFVSDNKVAFPYRNPRDHGTNAWDTNQFFVYDVVTLEIKQNNNVENRTLLLCKSTNRSSSNPSDYWEQQYPDGSSDITVIQDCKYGDPTSPSGVDYTATITTDDNVHTVIGTKLPNYLECNIPRQWICGEEIPFLLTATVNGVEVQILKDIYKVTTKNYALVPQLFNPLWWGEQSYRMNSAPYVRTRCTQEALLTYYLNQSIGVDLAFPRSIAYDEFNRINAANMQTGNRHLAMSTVHAACPANNTGDPVEVQRRITYNYEPFNPTSELRQKNNNNVWKQRFVNPQNRLIRYNEETVPTLGVNFYPIDGTYYPTNTLPNVNFDILNPSMPQIWTPYIPELCEGNTVHFGIRIKAAYWQELSAQNITAFNLYVSKPNFEQSILRSIGTIKIDDAPPGIYNKPMVTKDNLRESQDFGLVKTWLIEGDGQTVGKWDNYRGTVISSNAWKSHNGWIYSVPQNENGTARNTVPYFIDFQDLDARTEAESWTPDFMLWDYPTSGRTLTLNSSGEYYEGLGAKNIAVIKGRTFIDDPEDIGVVHYSDVQSGVAAQDIFSVEHKMRIGHNRFTAFVEYREQLWFFSRYDNYRLQMPNVYDETTWEFLDNVAMGTFSKKTVAVTPYGLVYANEAGVWITDGRMPENLAVSVLPSYQYLVRDKNENAKLPQIYNEAAYLGEYYLTDPITNEVTPLKVLNDNESGINEYMEIVYDTLRDELNIITPLWHFTNMSGTRPYAAKEFRMIYNFANRNWRVESFDIPLTTVGGL